MMTTSTTSKEQCLQISEFCKICNGREIIEVFREDLEEFEEVKCVCVK